MNLISLIISHSTFSRAFKARLAASLAVLLFVFCVTTSAWAVDGDVDPNFMLGSGVNGGVQSFVTQPDGKVLIGGWFSAVNGVTRNRVARLNANGGFDSLFNTGAGANAEISKLVLQPDGKILIGGLFTTYDNVPRNRIARLNADGSLDTTFDPGAGANDDVRTIALQQDGGVLIGGAFTSVRGVTSNHLARLTSSGDIDSSFVIGSGADAFVQAIKLQADGRILIGGEFTNYNTVSRNRIARLNADGTLDTTFNPGTGVGNYVVYTVVLQTDNKILIGGNFTSVNGQTRNHIARLNPNGDVDPTFVTGTSPDYEMYTIAVQSDGKIIVGGLSFTFSGTRRIGRLNSDGSLDTTFNASQIEAQVFDIEIQPDGRVFIGGWFGGRIAKLNADGSRDPSFFVQGGLGYEVRTIVTQPDGKILIGGSFLTVAGVPRPGLARLNSDGGLDATFVPGAGNPLTMILQPDGKIVIAGYASIARLNSDGSIDPSFNPGTGPTGTGSNMGIYAMALQPDGKFIIAGSFSNFDGTARRSLARLNANGSLDTSFNPGTGVVQDEYGGVFAVALQQDGKVIVGGYFSAINGVQMNSLARLNSDGSVDATFNHGTGANTGVHAISLQRDGKILIAGYFTNVNGIARNKIARLYEDGNLDTSFNAGFTDVTANIFKIVIQRDGRLLIAGGFDSIGSVFRRGLARLHPNGALDLSLNSGPDDSVNDVYALALQADGKILIGGSFTAVGGYDRRYLARLFNTPKSVISDFDGDGITDVAVFRPSSGSWYITNSSNSAFRADQFGTAGDQIVPADYDGDGKTDTAVFRPSNGYWYIIESSTNAFRATQFGQPGDIPAAGDFDSDGKSDIVVFRPSVGIFYLLHSSDNSFHYYQWGANGDLPATGDYDKDGKTDFAVFRPSIGTFYILMSSNGAVRGQQFGQNGDRPVAADFDGDGKTDIAIYRPSGGEWYYLQSSNNSLRGVAWGTVGDIPAAGDYDGDGKWDVAVFRPSTGTFYTLQSTTSALRVDVFGSNGDIPVTSAFDY